MSIASVAIQFTIIDIVSKGVDKIRDRFKALIGTSKDLQQQFDRMNKSFKYAAMSAVATREIYKGLKPAVSAAGELQAELLGVKAELMGAGKDARLLNNELKSIKSTAFSVQAWTPFNMAQIVALEKELIKAGGAIKDVTGDKGAAAASAALATYEELDPVETGKSLIGIGTPFKILADQYMSLADKISRASSASTTGVTEIVEAAKYASGPMAAMGRSEDEMLALSASMAQVGIDGSMAGTALKSFFGEAAKFKIFRDVKGNLLPTMEIIKKIRTMFSGMGDAKRQEKLGKMFNERGMQVAIALLNEGKGSYEEIMKAMDESASLQDKLNQSMTGFNNQITSLKGTFKSTIADLFQPALKPLTEIVKKTNEFVTLIGEASQKKESIGKAVSNLSLGAAATGGVATVGLTAAGIYYFRKVLKGVGGWKGLMKGAAGTAAGIAEGKAIEAATGVTPVFVTNWPGYISGGTSADVAGGLAAGSALKNVLPKLLPWLKGIGIIGGLTYLGTTDIGKAPFKWLDEKLPDLSKWLSEKTGIGETKNEINMQVNLDPATGKTMVKTDNMNTKANVSLNRGPAFAGGKN